MEMTAQQNSFGMIKLEVLHFLFTHLLPLWFVFKILNNQSFMAPVWMETEGNKELFCLVWGNSFTIWLKYEI